ncbi:mitochondrial ribosomal protein S25-domain-containing protein [Multifurca ochricompacta]|uniref:Small ribosomal subunit protein mS23 n=1 Tax=Multifurca ochricompacta TaxID=376703 RepID=A0AAD4ME11_9AGAM|nr:mitochondrial ribosomal protein S25-domain-containing protein [Multifurca ochricompacta]
MVRRIASQVHKQVSRLTRAGFLKTPPVWYQAVLEHLPLPLPAREPPSRTPYDSTPSKAKRATGPHPLPVNYIEDDIRRQFFRDHPFESFRPKNITEAGSIEEEDPINGLQWIRLRQRGRNPSPEDAVRFALNLHQAHGLALSDAYSTSHVATRFAAQEAAAYGANFGPSATAQGYEAESRVLEANELKSERMDDSARLARRRWRMTALGTADANRNEWSRGENYVRLWKEGVRPDYAPALTEPVTPFSKFDTSVSSDFMGTRSRSLRP